MKKSMLKTFSSIFIITVIAKVLGLLRDIVFAKFYGTGFEATAFVTALKIPTQIVDLVLSSAIVSTFVPVFNEIMKKDGEKKANEFANKFINMIALIATGISILGMIFAPQIINLLAGGLSGQTYQLTVELIRITFPMIIFTATAFSFVGFLQSYGEFNVPAMISGISNLVVIIFLFCFNQSTGIHGVAYCMVVAWLLQLLIQIPWAKKFGYPFKIKTKFKDKNLKKVFLLSVPILISTAVLPINNLISTRIASEISDSAIAILDYAYKLYIVISGVFTYAVGNIIFPELSRSATEKNQEEYCGLIQKAIRLLVFILIPLTFGLMLYRQDVISVMYERGEFTATSSLETSNALFYYIIGILGAGVVEVMNKAFYAKQDTKTPLYVGIAIIILNVILSIVLGNTSLTYCGLALATSITTLLNATILLVIANKKNASKNKKAENIVSVDLLKYLMKILISAIGMIAVVWMWNNHLSTILNKNIIENLIRMITGAGLGIIFYLAVTTLLKVNLLKELTKKESKVK